MLFNYTAIDTSGHPTSGGIEAVSQEVAISSLQRRGLVISSIVSAEKGEGLGLRLTFFDRVSNKDVVILSRQMATLFQAQVSALRVFRLLGEETGNALLSKVLIQIADDIQAGNSISKALAKHPKVFSDFYVNMVKSGEESGKLDSTLAYLADYLDRSYEVTSKAKNALIYPAFVVITFVSVMALMLTVVIPKISVILTQSGQEVPIYTQVVIGLSNFLVDYGPFLLIILAAAVIFFVRFVQTDLGKLSFDKFKLSVPVIKQLYIKLALSRIADNMNTMLSSGIPMVRAIELTGSVVENMVYKNAMMQSVEAVKAGSTVADAFSKHSEIPGIMVQMVKIGEETGELGNILKTLATFYTREVNNAVDTLVDLIEPVMIVSLGLGVAFLLAAVLVPIYNISSGAGF